MKRPVVLITYDIHITNFPIDTIRAALGATLEEQDRIGLPATFFFPAEAARILANEARELVAAGHEIGCHGLTHRPGELYDLLPEEEQRVRLREATIELEDIAQTPIKSFRAPAFRISGATFRALQDLGYSADVSVNSQRLGLLSSDPWNLTWMISPRMPYHPDERAPWRRGDLTIWEIPFSCFLLPFMSKTLITFGSGFMGLFFQGLLAEARLTGKPLVFMTHPEEFETSRETPPARSLTWGDFFPRRYGFGFRHALAERDPKRIASLSREFFDRMRDTSDLTFDTVNGYVRVLEREDAHSSPHAVPNVH